MKAVIYEAFGGPMGVETVPDPEPPPHGVVLKVEATGVCRSDWHGWIGHDPNIKLPHVPGHEFAGVVAAIGANVESWQPGDRVTAPFACACGSCPQCASGQHQVCERQSQPGFTQWGSFADYVTVDHAEVNLVRMPDDIDFATAASLGCRFATAFRAIVDQARPSAGQWVAIHGCGGVGLSAVMIASAIGARVVAIDITEEKLAFARALGATTTLNAAECEDIVAAIIASTDGGAQVSVDALGDPVTCFNSIACLRRRGRHIQAGLMAGEHQHPQVPMDQVIAYELEIRGSHGMQAYRYGDMLAMIGHGTLDPKRLITERIRLEQAPEALMAMNSFQGTGVTMIVNAD